MSEIPEPDDGAMVVTCENSGVIRAWWRDDTTAATDWEGQPGEHWFDAADSDPMGWEMVLKYAETVHAVQAEAMTLRPPCDHAEPAACRVRNGCPTGEQA